MIGFILASAITLCNGNSGCVTRQMTAQEQTDYDAAIAKVTSDAAAAKPFQAITRRQLADAFRNCSSAGTALQILSCIKDSLTNLETQ